MQLFLNSSIWMPAALDVYERYSAMRQLDSGIDHLAFLRNKWFILFGWSIVALLLLVLFAVRRMRSEKERHDVERRFAAEADRLRLTVEEREIVEAVAIRAHLRRKDSIFTLSESFDSGLSVLMQEVFAAGQDLVERKKLHGTIFSIKEKLGFAGAGRTDNRRTREQSSREIPVGTVVQIAPAGARQAARVQAEVVQNDAYELLLRPEIPLLCKPGDVWTVVFCRAAITWEFEAITMACNSKGLALNHSERIHFVNRRRYVRVAVRLPARICLFASLEDKPANAAMGLEFVPAQVTEIAGPGLRVKTDLETAVGQRVLIQFEFEPQRMVQDIALVRAIRESPAGRSIIVEMIGSDSRTVDEFVRMTNQLAGADQPEALEMEVH
ncbi:MAG: hypothetical protein LLF76_11490 [Planctomycetaceae bacterium]|nr:hypothetical protein [Planctomycetaceae bacterium]